MAYKVPKSFLVNLHVPCRVDNLGCLISYTGNCWPCGCYAFIAAAVLALAVVLLYVNNGIPGKKVIEFG